jgi:sugar/nucleoside kinase (ribokinase family)
MRGDGSLFCIGLTTIDIVALPVALSRFDGVRLLSALQMAPAGTAAGTALVAATLGIDTRLLGAVGDDAMGRFVRGELARAGVDTTHLATMPDTTTSATMIPIDPDGNRMIFHAPGAAARIALTPAAGAVARSASAIHYAGIGAPGLDGGAGAALLADARSQGVWVTCDLISPGPGAPAELRRLLPHVDVFMPSAVEARFATGEQDLERAGRALLAWGAGACVIKNGAAGALAFGADGTLHLIPALPVENIVDTTTCGDSFCAGFIAARLRGRGWIDALHFGAATASLIARGPATLGRLRSFSQVDGLLGSPHV